MHKLSVTAVIPTKNEGKTIGEVIDGARKFCAKVIVVDGHSHDETRKIAEQHGARVFLDPTKGKGLALRYASKYVATDIIVFLDADGSHETKDIPLLIKPLQENKADLVVASRMLGGSDELHGDFSNFMRLVGTSLIALAINYRWNVRLTDVENGFRAIRSDVFSRLRLKSKSFDIEEEMVMKCLRSGFRVAEVPSHEYRRKYGISGISLIKSGHKFIWRLLVNLF